MRGAVLACLLGAVAADQPSKRSPAIRDPFCFRPLDEFCAAKDKCPTYATHVERLRAAGCPRMETVGRCGTLRVTHRSDCLHGETRYFDKAGKLVAVRVWTDVYLKDSCPDWQHYGAVVTCQLTNTNMKQLCKPK
jgi:hypothetical protein